MADTPWGKAAEEAWQSAALMKEAAEGAEDYGTHCVEGEKVFYTPDSQSRMPGHIYSRPGTDEYGITGCCEWHFDKWFPPECDLVKRFPGDSPGLWEAQVKAEYYREMRERGL